MSLPTFTDLKAHLNITSTADDEELQDMLDAAVDIVTDIVGPFDDPASVTETHYALSSDVLVLRKMPVGTLTAVSSRYGATTTPLVLGDYELDAATGIVRAVSGYFFRGTFTVTYTAGRTDTPAAIRLACLIIAAHLWQTQRGGGSLRPTFPGEEPDLSPVGVSGYAIPNRAKELLAPYMRPSVA